MRGAAAATARKFGLTGSSGSRQVKLFDDQVKSGTSSRKYKGRSSSFLTAEVAENIEAAFDAAETMTFKELGQEVGLPETTAYRYAKDKLGYRCIGTTVRPFPSDAPSASTGCDVRTASCSPRYLSFLVFGLPQKRVRIESK